MRLSLPLLAGLAAASPFPAKNNAGCNLQNVVLQAFNAKASATAFCSSFLSISTKTLSATATATATTSTTVTVTTGTEVLTAPTLVYTVVASETTTTVTATTVDDTNPSITARAAVPDSALVDVDRRALPPLLAGLLSPAISSACKCLSLATPSVTNTVTVTNTQTLSSYTSTWATTTTETPVAFTTTTATETDVVTSTILKSDLLATVAALVHDNGYDAFCSDLLGYTTPVTTQYASATTTALTTSVSTSTVTSYVYTTVTSIQRSGPNYKRQAGTDATPEPLATYAPDVVSSGCALAVTSPATSTVSATVTGTVTSTVVPVSLVTTTVTATSTAVCLKYPGSNGGFESGTFSYWTVYNPINGAGGAWSVATGLDAPRGAYAAQVSMRNPGNTGGFAAYITRTLATCPGRSYTMQFDYRCLTAPAAASLQAYGSNGVGFGTALRCSDSVGTWRTATWTFTASANSVAAGVWTTQNGRDDTATFQVDNFVVTLNE